MAGRAAARKSGRRERSTEGKGSVPPGGPTTTVTTADTPDPRSGATAAQLRDAQPSVWTWNGFQIYLQQVNLEMKRVTWPGRRELQAATTVVMFTLLIFAGYLGILDWILKRVFH